MANNLVGKIAAAALDVGGRLKADKRNKDQDYNYISADKILSECGQALFGQGVLVIPSIGEQETTMTEYVNDYNKTKRRYDSRVSFVFTITDGETSLEEHWYGLGSDYMTPDKALYKAITSGHKYYLMKLLCIGEGNEDSEHEADDEKAETKVAQKGSNGKPAQRQAPEPPATANGKQDPQVIEHHPGIEHPPIDKPGTPAKLSLDMVIDHMRELSQLPRNNVKATLAYCKLTPEQSTYEQYEEWWKQYKTARNQDMTPAESGNYANQLFGLEEQAQA